MKKILLFVLILITIQSFGQNPSNYQYRTVRERLLAFMVDSSFHVPRYNGIPSGLRVGSSYNSGGLAADTLNHGAFLYSGGIWRKIGTEGIKCGLTCSDCGIVTWSGTGLTFDVTSADYNLNSVPYHYSGGSVTLDAADGSFDRFDAIVLTSSGLTKITGTASSDPQLPQFDPCSNILLTYIFVQTGATTPTQVTDELIYDENAETWTHATSGTISANFASTAASSVGTKSLAIASWSNNANIIWTAPGALNTNNYTTFSYYIKLTATMANNINISAQFFNGTTAVSNIVVSPFTKTYTSSFQGVVFSMSQFTFTSNVFTNIKLIFNGTNTNTVYIDFMRLQGGIIQPPSGGGSSVNIYNSDGTLSGNRKLKGLNNTYSLQFDSLNSFSVLRNGISRMYQNSSSSGLFSPDGTNSLQVSNSVAQLNFNSGANYLWLLNDSSIAHKRISYEGNIHGTLFPYSLVDKSYVDSVASASGSNFANADLTFTGNRTHAMAGNTLKLTSSGNEQFFINPDSRYRLGAIDDGVGPAMGLDIDNVAGTVKLGSLTGFTGLSLSALPTRYIKLDIAGTNYFHIDGSGGIFLTQGLIAGTSADSVVVIDPSTGQLKKRNASSFGGDGGISRISPLDSMAKDAKGIQVTGISLVPQSADSTYAGLLKNTDYNRSYKLKSENNPTGTITMNIDSSGQRMYFFTSTGGRTLAFSNLRRGDIALITFDNTSGSDITLTLPSNSYVNNTSAATTTIPTGLSSLSLYNYDGTYLLFGQSQSNLTNFSFTDGNGFDGTVTNSTSTPALALNLQEGFEPWYRYYFDASTNTSAYYDLGSSGTGSGITIAPAIDRWMGGRQWSTGTTTTGLAYSHFGNSGAYAPITINNDTRFNFGTKIRIDTLSDGTNTYEMFMGFGDFQNSSAGITDGVYFRYIHSDSSGKWIAVTESNNTKTEVATSTTVAVATDYKLTISVYNGHAIFYINGTQAADITTNIPTTTARSTSVVESILKSAGTIARLMYVEWIGFGNRSN